MGSSKVFERPQQAAGGHFLCFDFITCTFFISIDVTCIGTQHARDAGWQHCSNQHAQHGQHDKSSSGLVSGKQQTRQASHPRQLHTDDWEHKPELALGLVCPCVLECAMAAAACLRTRLGNTAVLGINRFGVGANKIIGALNLLLELE